jgi:(1->4)-alpha-D-glucan 1-alpha-D-glucosylmutase
MLVPDASRPPTGEAVWEDTVLQLPPGVSGRFRDVFTDATIDIPAGDAPVLRMADVLAEFPVALLQQE